MGQADAEAIGAAFVGAFDVQMNDYDIENALDHTETDALKLTQI